jgi:hypothetical protein
MGYGGSPNPQFTIEGDELQYIRRDGTNKLIATQDDVETVESITFQNSVNPLNESIIRADTGADAQTLLLFGKSASTDGAWIQLVGEDDTTDTNQLLMGYGGNSNSQFTISGDELQYIRRDGVNKLIATQDDVATVNDITFQNPTTPTNESIVRADVGANTQKLLLYGKSTEANGAWIRVIGEDDPISPNRILMGSGGSANVQFDINGDESQRIRQDGTLHQILCHNDLVTDVEDSSTTNIHPTSVTSVINDRVDSLSDYVYSLPVPLTQGAVYTGSVVENAGVFRVSNRAGSVPTASLESALGLTAGTLSSLGYGTVIEGSAYSDKVYVSQGETFSFNWDWNSNEAPIIDFWFVSLMVGTTEVIFDYQPADGTTGTFSWVATESGLLQYGVGVVDVTDSIIDSNLYIDTFSPASVIPTGWSPVNTVARDNEADAFSGRYTFDQTLAEDTEHTIGASGTTATNTWSDMNDLPSGTYDITLKVFVDVTASGSPEYDLKVYGANDDGETIDDHNLVSSVNGTTNFKNSSVGEFKVRVTDRVFRLKWSEILGVSVTFTGSLSLVGFSLVQ